MNINRTNQLLEKLGKSRTEHDNVLAHLPQITFLQKNTNNAPHNPENLPLTMIHGTLQIHHHITEKIYENIQEDLKNTPTIVELQKNQNFTEQAANHFRTMNAQLNKDSGIPKL